MIDRQALKSALARTPECLSIEALGALSPDEARGHHHISGCVRCQTELALLREFESSDPLPDEGAAVAWISSHLERNLEAIKHPSGNAQRKALHADSRPAISWWDRLFETTFDSRVDSGWGGGSRCISSPLIFEIFARARVAGKPWPRHDRVSIAGVANDCTCRRVAGST